MTGSDLCSSTKPWDLQLLTLNDIYSEFYTQEWVSSNGINGLMETFMNAIPLSSNSDSDQ